MPRKRAGTQLTDKQRRFVEEYVVDFNATQAAKRAGYSVRSAHDTGRENLRKPEIQAAIAARANRLAQKAEITAQRVLEELAKLGFANMRDYIRVTEQGEPVVDLSALTRDQAAAIQEVTVEDYLDGRGDDAREVRRVRFKLAGKEGPLEKLGKYLGLFGDNPPLQPGTEVTEIRRTIVRPSPPAKE